MKWTLSLLILISLSLGACKKSKPSDEEVVSSPTNIFRGAPSALAGQWAGKCLEFECTSQLSIQLTEEKVFIQLFYLTAEKIHGLVVGPYLLMNNNILTKDEIAIGSMGHGGFFIDRPDMGKITVVRQDSGELLFTLENNGQTELQIQFTSQPQENTATGKPMKFYWGNLLAFFGT